MTVTATPTMKEIAFIAALFFIQQCTSVHVPPSIEPCPDDSVLVEDTCKCDPSKCLKPPCLHTLIISVNATDLPGSCCPIYSCEGCSNATLIEGQCPCAHDAVLNSRGQCQCVDPHKSLVGEECVCDSDRCELPQVCDKNHVPVTDKEGCCPKTKCIKCPEDSYATNNNDEAIEDKCVCFPCKNNCEPGEKAVIIHRGSRFPGNCCDLYKCVKFPEEETLPEEEALPKEEKCAEGKRWHTADGLECTCKLGVAFCETKDSDLFRPCHNEGSVYKHNESWMMDSCTNCTCVHGETRCITHMCEVAKGHMKKPECHPLNCSKVCPDGYKLNKHGCKICKCNPSPKYDDLLYKYNITKNKLKDILEEYFATKQPETASTTKDYFTTTDTPSSTDFKEYDYTTAAPRTDSHLLHVILWPLVAIVTLLTIIAAVMIRKCKSHGSYDTNPTASNIYERVKLKTDTFFNNNYINKNVKGTV